MVISKSWVKVGSVIGATIAGTIGSLAYARLAYYHQRPGLPVDAIEQLRCIAADPMRFVRVGFHDLLLHGGAYLEQMIGRFGLMDVNLPSAIIGIEVLLLIAVGLGSGIRLGGIRRAMAIAIAAVTACGVILSQYLTWSIICSDQIEGVQGRYFLPVLPLALAAISIPRNRRRLEMPVVLLIATFCDAVAFIVLWRVYW